jgi:hypothetical protein
MNESDFRVAAHEADGAFRHLEGMSAFEELVLRACRSG